MKLYDHYNTATINPAKLNGVRGNNKHFPKSARNFHQYILVNADNNAVLMTITHGETPHREYRTTAQVQVTATKPFFEMVGLKEQYFNTLEKGSGCGYDKHNSTAFAILRNIGIEPYGTEAAHGGIFGGGANGSETILKTIANYFSEIGINAVVIET